MRIVYVGAIRMPWYDAAAARVLSVCKMMRDLGHEVIIISQGGKEEAQHCDSDNKYRIDGIQYIVTNELVNDGLIHRIKARFMRGRKSMRILKQLNAEKPVDLVVMYNPNFQLTKFIMRFEGEHNCKIASDLTEWYDNNELHIFDIWCNCLNMTKLQKRVKNKIVISSFFDNYYPESNNIVIPATCDAQESKWHASLEAEQRPNLEDGITLIYAGSPAKKDKLHVVINAIDKLCKEGISLNLMILGPIKNTYLKHYRNLLHNTDLHPRIHFLGCVPQTDIPTYYKLADYMVLLRDPSRKNMMGFPTKFAEAMMSGTPVIANLTSDLGEYLIDGHTGYILDCPSEESLIKTLMTKVVPGGQNIAQKLKKETMSKMSLRFDYRSYSLRLKQFLCNLK